MFTHPAIDLANTVGQQQGFTTKPSRVEYRYLSMAAFNVVLS